MFTTPNPEIAAEFPHWDYLRARKIYERTLTEEEKGCIATLKLLFFDKKPWSLYEIELFNSEKRESFLLKPVRYLSKTVRDELGMHQVDVQDLAYWVHEGFYGGSKEWYWYPWPKGCRRFSEQNRDEAYAEVADHVKGVVTT